MDTTHPIEQIQKWTSLFRMELKRLIKSGGKSKNTLEKDEQILNRFEKYYAHCYGHFMFLKDVDKVRVSKQFILDVLACGEF